MKKVNIAILLAGLFITVVLLYVMKEGVHLHERRIIKWSKVESAANAGERVAQFFYPIIEESRRVVLWGEGDFYNSFSKAFKELSLKNSPQTQISKETGSKDDELVIHLIAIDQDLVPQCRQGQRAFCVAIKASKKLKNKKRNPLDLWISMYLLGEKKAVLLYSTSAKKSL